MRKLAENARTRVLRPVGFQREDRLTIILSLVIGVLVGLVVVAFILLTGRLAARMYPAGGPRGAAC